MATKVKSIRVSFLNEEPDEALIKSTVEDEVGSDVEVIDYVITSHYEEELPPIPSYTTYVVKVKYRKTDDE